MKLSKNLLQAMTIGLAIGATATLTTSCNSIKEDAQVEPKVEAGTEQVENSTEHVENWDDYDCPPCGRG